jgi:hypothetical protein
MADGSKQETVAQQQSNQSSFDTSFKLAGAQRRLLKQQPKYVKGDAGCSFCKELA